MLWLHDLFWKDELELFVGVIKNRIHNYMIISTISWLNMAKEEYGKKKRKKHWRICVHPMGKQRMCIAPDQAAKLAKMQEN